MPDPSPGEEEYDFRRNPAGLRSWNTTTLPGGGTRTWNGFVLPGDEEENLDYYSAPREEGLEPGADSVTGKED